MTHLLAGFRVTITVPDGATTLGVHPDGTPYVEDTMDPSDHAAAISLAEVVARWHTGVQELDAALAPLLGDATAEDLRHYRQAAQEFILASLDRIVQATPDRPLGTTISVAYPA